MAFSAATLAQTLSTLQRPAPCAQELFYRCINFAYARASMINILTGQYSGMHGGRCNPPNGQPVCYLSATQTNATFEVEQEQLLLGLRPASPPPRLLVAVSVEGAVLLDLCNPMICLSLGLESNETDLFIPSHAWKALNREDGLAPLQCVGNEARAAGYDGVRYPAILSQYIGNTLPALFNVALFMSPRSPHDPHAANIQIVLHDHALLSEVARTPPLSDRPRVAVG
jgi:hypothetical protein